MNKPNQISVPEQLRKLDRWVVWRKEKRHRKLTKVPYNVRTGTTASSTDPATWCSFGEATTAYARGGYSGLGFVFSAADRIVGIDLDKCRDPETGDVEPWAKDIVDKLATYTEVSPSGRGLHLYVLGTLPPGGRKKGKIEVYESSRYFTVTGAHVPGTPPTIEERSERLREFHEVNFGRSKDLRETRKPSGSQLDDAAVIAKARGARNGEKFARLFEGDWRGYPSQSEADLALCLSLSFWCGHDPVQVDRIFRQSRLFRPKWDERHYGSGTTYGEKTVQTAVSRSGDAYQKKSERPEICVTNRSLEDMTAEAMMALEQSNVPPTTFVRSGGLARVLTDENERPVLEQMTESQVRLLGADGHEPRLIVMRIILPSERD